VGAVDGRALDDEVAAGLNELVATGTLPSGWVCERARAV
jgi:hypothetical protein